jgi:CheY-like chemotaxis protein
MAPDSAALRIIVVDDERVIAYTLALVLKSRGHRVRVAYSAERAIELLSAFSPHALTSDVMIPGMSGIDLANYIVQNCPDCKILLIPVERTSQIATGTRFWPSPFTRVRS